MKKNAVGRVLAHKEPVVSRIAALHIPARLLCLLLAVVIWLAVVNLNAISEKDDGDTDPKQKTEETA